MVISFIAFGVLGMILEIVFGAIKSLLKERSYELKGSTSVWMFFVFGLTAIVYPIIAVHISEFPWWVRGLVYTVAIYIIEFACGWVLTKMTVCPWKYPDKWSIKGLVYLPNAPLWFVFGLGVEWVWPKIKAISYALS